MKLVLILMVRNESKILERCLTSVEGIVDAACIHDTGSTDATCEIARTWLETRKGSLSTSVWRDFGYNRTQSFLAAKDFVDKAGWDAKETYGLLLDADMEFVPGTLRSQTLTEIGYSVLQSAGSLEYLNCRLVRMDHPWTCRGVTHEYWDGGEVKSLSKDICWINDRNDGGCKSDKFERDARLLEQGLKDEPTNGRYMFYLAQTYHSLGRWTDAIRMYKQRIKAGGWFEETWYCHYMIGNSYLSLNDPIRFEAWMLRAAEVYAGRTENLYKLVKYFRDTSQHHKAWHYLEKARKIKRPVDALFLEMDVYTHLYSYEATILLYYIGKLREGLRESVQYLLAHAPHRDGVYTNLKFYIEPIAKTSRTHPVPRNAAGLNYQPSSISMIDSVCENVRFVNYDIDQTTGSYMMKEGAYSSSHKVRTENVYWNGRDAKLMKVVPTLPSRDTHILGLEDLRVYHDASGARRFLATSREFSESIRMVHGTYDTDRYECRDLVVLESPTNSDCEKNWIPINGTNQILYSWSPLRIGHIKGNAFVEDRQYATPWLWSHFRGSASPVRVRNELWVLVHFVEYSMPRKYFHLFVALDATSYRPKSMTLPFVFAAQGIEYCLGVRTAPFDTLEVAYSSWDSDPTVAEIPISALEWVQL